MPTRTKRNPQNYDVVTHWGFTHIPWPDFVRRFPTEAASFAQNYTEGWAPEEIADCGGPDVLSWKELWDDEMFTDTSGRPVALANITGPGGSLWMAPGTDGWDEVMYDDLGHREGDPDYDEE
jgi:hypothetical protein